MATIAQIGLAKHRTSTGRISPWKRRPHFEPPRGLPSEFFNTQENYPLHDLWILAVFHMSSTTNLLRKSKPASLLHKTNKIISMGVKSAVCYRVLKQFFAC